MAIVTHNSNTNVLAKINNPGEHPAAALNNLVAVTLPSASDDINSGYSPGSIWYNTVSKFSYICISADAGAAAWSIVGGGAGGVGGINYIQNSDAEAGVSDWGTYNDIVLITGSATSDSTGDFITATSHGLILDQVIYLTNAPAGLSSDTRYYVINPSTDTIQLALSRRGPIIDITSNSGSIGIYSISVVDGIGGSATMTFDNGEASAPLRGTASFRYMKAASNESGQGISTDFTIARADLGKILNITFEYRLGSGSMSPNDIEVWIYDITNARLIQPTGYLFDGAVTTSSGNFKATFQTDYTSLAYRLIIHNINTTLTAYTLLLDTVKVTSDPVGSITPVTVWKSFTPNFLNMTLGNATHTFKMRRVGDSLEIVGRLSWGSTTSATSTGALLLPDGLQIDIDKCSTSLLGTCSVDHTISTPSSLVQPGTVYRYNANGVYFTLTNQDGNNQSLFQVAINWGPSAGAPFGARAWTTNDVLGVNFTVPILGWDSSVTMSSIDDGRPVNLIAHVDALTTLNPGDAGNHISFPTKVIDTHAAFNGSSFTAPSSGVYHISVNLMFSGETSITPSSSPITCLIAYAQGGYNLIGRISTNDALTDLRTISGSIDLQMNAGDIFSVYVEFNSASGTLQVWGSPNSYPSILSVHKISGTSRSIAREEQVLASVYMNSPQSLTGAVENVVKWDTKRKDTHGMYNPSTGQFTIPVNGDYSIQGMAYCDYAGPILYMWYLNGNSYVYGGQSISTAILVPQSATFVNLSAGDVIELKGTPQGSSTMVGAIVHNCIVIKRL